MLYSTKVRTLEHLRAASKIKPEQEAAVKMKVMAIGQADAAIGSYEKATSLLVDLENPDYKFESGAAADLRLGLLKLRELVASDPNLRERIMNTEFMTSRMGSEVFGMIKTLGIGARGLDTPAEREFMQEVLTGRVSLNKDTLIEMAKLRQQTSKDRINKFYKRTESGVFDDIFAESGRTRGERARKAHDVQRTSSSGYGCVGEGIREQSEVWEGRSGKASRHRVSADRVRS